jgi:hypothetical protein
MPMVSTIPAMPGSVSVAPIRLSTPKISPTFRISATAGEDPEQAVAQDHEDQHGDEGHQRRQSRPPRCCRRPVPARWSAPRGRSSRRASAPARSRTASSVELSTVKLPVICPDPPVIACRITGAEITSSSSTMAKGAPTLAAVYSPKARAPVGLKRKVTTGCPVCWSKGGLAVGQVVARHDRRLFEDVEHPLLVHRRQDLLARLHAFIGAVGAAHHRLEGQPRGGADQVLQLLRRADARHLDQDPVRALALDRRLPRAGLVDAAAHDLDRLLHRPVVGGRPLRLAQRDDQRVALPAHVQRRGTRRPSG